MTRYELRDKETSTANSSESSGLQAAGRTSTVLLYHVDLSRPRCQTRVSTSLLSEPELARAARLKQPADRDRFAAGRVLIRTVLASQAGCSPGDVDLRFSERGKPYVSGGPSFNLSHSGNSVLLGVCGQGSLGVDIEAIADWNERDEVAQRVFSSAELEQYTALPPKRRISAFFRGWTRKEAFVKALGTGINIDLKAFDVNLIETGENTLLDVRSELARRQCWSIRSISLIDGVESAIALDVPNFDIVLEDATGLLHERRIVNS